MNNSDTMRDESNGVKLAICIMVALVIYLLSNVFCVMASYGNMKLIRRSMTRKNLRRVKVNDFTIAMDKPYGYYADLYIFRGDEKIAVNNDMLRTQYENKFFPFLDCAYIYNQSKIIADKEKACVKKEEQIKYEKMLN